MSRAFADGIGMAAVRSSAAPPVRETGSGAVAFAPAWNGLVGGVGDLAEFGDSGDSGDSGDLVDLVGAAVSPLGGGKL